MLKILFFLLLLSAPTLFGQENKEEKALTLEDTMYQYERLCKEFKESNPKMALGYARNALGISQQIKDYDSEGFYLTYLGAIFKNMGQFDSSIYYYEKALKMQRAIDNQQGEAGNYHNLGMVYRVQGKYDWALEYHLRALALFKQNDMPDQEATVYNHLGSMYAEQGKQSQAYSYYKKALDLQERIKSTSIKATTFSFLGEWYGQQGQMDLCMYYFGKAVHLYEEHKEQRSLARTYISIGKIYAQRKQLDKAIQSLDAALEQYRKVNDLHGMAQASSELAFVHYLNNENSKAENLFYQSLYLADSIGAQSTAIQLHHRLANYFAQQKQYDSAFKHLQQAYLLKDSTLNVEDLKQMNELQAKYEYKDQQYKIELLEKEQKLQALENDFNMAILLSLLSIFGISGGALYFKYRNNSRHNLVLADKNARISEALAQKEMLLKEIHHRVKNNLQIISSLLNLQLKNSQGKTAEELLQLSQSRIQAMAIIHEKLYQSHNLKNISLKEYLYNIVDYLKRSLALESQNIHIEVSSDDIYLDMDWMVSCGLILNELITNSIKHAFKKHQKGQLRVKAQLQDGLCILSVSDNGQGLPAGFELKKSPSLGFKLILGLAKQLKAKFEHCSDEQGSTFSLMFKIPQTQ